MKVCAVYDKYSEYQDEEKRRLADYYTFDFMELMEKGIIAGPADEREPRPAGC